MKLRSASRAILDAFRVPVSPYPIGVFRILFGMCFCVTLLLLHSDWLVWFGTHAWITMETIEKAESGFRLDLFALLPQDDRWTTGLYWLFLTASVTLTLGLATRLSSFIVFLGLNSINQRMPLILHGGDTFLRDVGFFLCFAASGTALSIDAVLRKRRNSQGRIFVPAWPQRLIQYQLAIVYLASFWWKIQGPAWRNGTALYYVINLREIRQFPLPHFMHEMWLLRLGTWFALLFELMFPIFVWFKPFRKWIFVLGLAFHLGLEYTLNIPMFQWDMLAAYVLFVDAVWLQKFLVRVHCVFSSKRSGEHHAATLLSVLDTRQIVPHDCCNEKRYVAVP